MARQTPASERARRVVALLGHLTPGSALPLADLAARVGATPDELAHDLETLSLCGVAPYSPDQLVEVFVEDGMVETYAPLPAVSGAVRLSTAEAEALSAALAAAGFTAADPLVERLLAATSSAFSAESLERTLRSAVAGHDSAVYEILAQTLAAEQAVRITYQRDGDTEPHDRVIEPLRLFADRGAWYVAAWCRTADEPRTFRVDRIRAAEPTAEPFDRAARVAAGGAGDVATAFDASGLPSARLRFAPGEPFVEREWPGGRVEGTETDGATIATVPIGRLAWVARRVVARLGAVEALAPAELREEVARIAAARIAETAGS